MLASQEGLCSIGFFRFIYSVKKTGGKKLAYEKDSGVLEEYYVCFYLCSQEGLLRA